MRVKSINISNYKSFGEENSMMILDDITTIIGKNESGKSNLVECLGKLNLSGITDDKLLKSFNRNNGKYPEISVVLEPYSNEIERYGLKDSTTLKIVDNYNISIEGAFSSIIKNNKEFQKNREKMNELSKSIANISVIDQTQRNNLLNIIKMINNSENIVFINYSYINQIIDKINKFEEYRDFCECIKNCINFLININEILPKFIELKDMSLKSKYTRKYLDDVNESKPMLKHLLNCIDMKLEDVMRYWNLTTQADKINFEEELNEKLSYVINNFNDFYSQEQVEMQASFESDSLNFIVRTTKKFMNFEERSNGLRWYLNMYIQLLSRTKKTEIQNYIILIDEPGVFLHVNAQKEILNLFEEFVNQNNQVIYTTHSPFMIYKDDLYRTRTIIKDDSGNSNIGNRYYSLPHKMGSKLETITPLLKAIGMDINCNILDFNSDKINVITEGISDYNYLKGYYIQKGVDNEPNIIPSNSVDNIHNIISIFIGWGCKFKIILDQDNAGRGQYKVLTNKLLVNNTDISFTDGKDSPDTRISCTIENVFSANDKESIGINYEDYNIEKAYYSLETLKRIENNEFNYDDETMSNFDKIIEQLFN